MSNDSMLTGYRNDINILKSISIIAVVLYHALGNNFSTGYLGVDVFFTIGGYLVLPKIFLSVMQDQFDFIHYIKKRISRILPLLLIVCCLVVSVAIFFMVPEDLLNVVESAVASVLFVNNYLSLYLCADYWDWTNEFKPLMHTWYTSVLMQIYIVVPLLIIGANYLIKKLHIKERKKVVSVFLMLVSVLSFGFFYLCDRSELSFYFFSARIYEFLVGGLVGILFNDNEIFASKISIVTKRCVSGGAFIGILAILTIGSMENTFKNNILLPLIVILTVLYLIFGNTISVFDGTLGKLGIIGKASYSIFIWHQVILAFYRYFVACKLDFKFWVGYVFVISFLTFLSYNFVEAKIEINTIKNGMMILGTVFILGIICFFIWLRAGVLYDIPELDISVNNIERRKNPHYCDRIYDLDKSFDQNNDRTKILVIGNSFARDFANILLESEWSDSIDLRYSFGYDAGRERIGESDYVFVFGSKKSLPDYFWDSVKEVNHVYGIGTKNFGDCIGQYFIHRKSNNYYLQNGIIHDNTIRDNERLAKEWGTQYINLIQYLKVEEGVIRIFTDDDRYISYDMHHLSQAGAEYLAKVIDLDKIFSNE